MRPFRTTITFLTAAILSCTTFTGVSSADGLHLVKLSDGTPYGWTGGCHATFHLDEHTNANYRSPILWSLDTITSHTGITFTETSDKNADLTYTQLDDFTEPGMETAYAYQLGKDVYLRDPQDNISKYGSHMTSLYDYRAVLHETMHWLGLAHDPELDSDEIMGVTNTGATPNRLLHFGESDLEGLAYVTELNGCTPAEPARNLELPRTQPAAAVNTAPRRRQHPAVGVHRRSKGKPSGSRTPETTQ